MNDINYICTCISLRFTKVFFIRNGLSEIFSNICVAAKETVSYKYTKHAEEEGLHVVTSTEEETS
jgi:hypothetical protein